MCALRACCRYRCKDELARTCEHALAHPDMSVSLTLSNMQSQLSLTWILLMVLLAIASSVSIAQALDVYTGTGLRDAVLAGEAHIVIQRHLDARVPSIPGTCGRLCGESTLIAPAAHSVLMRTFTSILRSYKRLKGRSYTLEKQISTHPHKPHATSQPSHRLSTDSPHY